LSATSNKGTSGSAIATCSQQFVTVAVWTIGEYADLLLSGTKYPPNYTAGDIVGIMEYIIKDPNTESKTKQYVVQSLLKLTERLSSTGSGSGSGDSIGKVEDMIREWKTSLNVEIQQRACEYDSLVARSDSEDLKRQILEHVPPPEDLHPQHYDNNNSNNNNNSSSISNGDNNNNNNSSSTFEQRQGSLLDDEFGLGPMMSPDVNSLRRNNNNQQQQGQAQAQQQQAQQQQQGSKPSGGGTGDLLSSLFGAPSNPSGGGGSSLMDLMSSPTPATSSGFGGGLGGGGLGANTGSGGLGGLGLGGLLGANPASPSLGLGPAGLGSGGLGAGGLGGAGAVMDITEMKAVEKNGIVGTFGFRKKEGGKDVEITMNWSNANRDDARNFVVMVAVPRYITLQMENASGNVLPAMGMGRVSQKLTLDCSNAGGQPLGLMLKLQYDLGGNQVVETAQVTKFPPGY